jgi:hypothetical protein
MAAPDRGDHCSHLAITERSASATLRDSRGLGNIGGQ